MNIRNPFSGTILHVMAITVFLVSLGPCLAQDEDPSGRKEESKKIRVLCVRSMKDKPDKVFLAQKSGDQTWHEYGELELVSSFITEWVPVKSGTTHFIKKNGDQIVSLGSFDMLAGRDRAVLVVLLDSKQTKYNFHLIDPSKLAFSKGKALIVNYASMPAVVRIGDSQASVQPGKHLVHKIKTNEDGMYRLLIGYVGNDKSITACYDRYVSSNPNTRKFILLFPDPDVGLRTMSLSEFGPFE